jgi:C4-dicarboxylate-binding protein DctP
MVSLVFWKKLTPDQQKLMVDLWAQNIPTYRKNMANAQAKARDELVEHGVKFVTPTPAEIAAVRKKQMADQDAIAKDLKLTPELVKAATEAMEKAGS